MSSCSIYHNVFKQNYNMDPLVDVPPYHRHFLLPCVLHNNGRCDRWPRPWICHLIQFMVAADSILITDIQRDIRPKGQPPGMRGAGATTDSGQVRNHAEEVF